MVPMIEILIGFTQFECKLFTIATFCQSSMSDCEGGGARPQADLGLGYHTGLSLFMKSPSFWPISSTFGSKSMGQVPFLIKPVSV